MIETPRAALRADDIAEVADFFSFGTNDLTQMTFGFSRDDVEGRIIGPYLELGLLPRNPFETIDHGRGRRARPPRHASGAARANPDLQVGVCGEHGGDPESIEVFWSAGVDYVSCSPYRVPIARLAAAQAVLRTPRLTVPLVRLAGDGETPEPTGTARVASAPWRSTTTTSPP